MSVEPTALEEHKTVDAAEHLNETDYPRVPRQRHSPETVFDNGEALGAESEPGPLPRALPVLDQVPYRPGLDRETAEQHQAVHGMSVEPITPEEHKAVDAAEHLNETDYPRVHSPGAIFDCGEALGAESEPGPVLRGLAERENAPVLDPYTDRRFDEYFKKMEIMSLELIPDWPYRTATSIMNTQSPEETSQAFGHDRGTAQQYALKLAENRDMELKHSDAESVVEPSGRDKDVETERLAENTLTENQLFGNDNSIDDWDPPDFAWAHLDLVDQAVAKQMRSLEKLVRWYRKWKEPRPVGPQMDSALSKEMPLPKDRSWKLISEALGKLREKVDEHYWEQRRGKERIELEKYAQKNLAQYELVDDDDTVEC